MIKSHSINLIRFLLVIFFILIWEWLAKTANQAMFPPLSAIVRAISIDEQLALLLHFSMSLYRILVGLILGSLFGVVCGYWMAMNERRDRILSPFVFLLYPFPKIALVPFLIFLFGIGDLSKISLVCINVAFPMLVSARDGARHIDRQYIDAFRSLSQSQQSLFWHVTLPASLPQLLSSLRLSLGTSIAVLFLRKPMQHTKELAFIFGMLFHALITSRYTGDQWS